MFINQLSSKEKQALMSLLIDISKADGTLTEQEVGFLSSYAQEIGVELNMDEVPSISGACRDIETYKGKVVAIQEIVKLAIVDGNYDESERTGAIAISEMLQLPLSKFEDIESWVLDGEHWVHRGIQMLEEA